MVVYKRKKNTRQRGSHTHGWGAKKKHRGSGHRGGTGMAGTGKRADSKKPSIWKEDYFGKCGFKTGGKRKKIINAVNLSHIEENLDKLLLSKMVSKEDGIYIVDLNKMGYNKLLGKGKTNNKYKIMAQYASKKIIDEITKNGGSIQGLIKTK